jgi:hypothetical protein
VLLEERFVQDRHHFSFSDSMVGIAFMDNRYLSTSSRCKEGRKVGDSEEEVGDMSWVIGDDSFSFSSTAH